MILLPGESQRSQKLNQLPPGNIFMTLCKEDHLVITSDPWKGFSISTVKSKDTADFLNLQGP